MLPVIEGASRPCADQHCRGIRPRTPRACPAGFLFEGAANGFEQAWCVHRRRIRHDRPRHPRAARGAARDRAEKPATGAAPRHGGAPRHHGRGRPRHPLLTGRCGARGGGAGQRARGGRAQVARRLDRASRRPRLDLRLPRDEAEPGRSDRRGAQGRQSRLLPDRRDRPPAAAGRSRGDPARLPDLDQRAQRLFRRWSWVDRGA